MSLPSKLRKSPLQTKPLDAIHVGIPAASPPSVPFPIYINVISYVAKCLGGCGFTIFTF